MKNPWPLDIALLPCLALCLCFWQGFAFGFGLEAEERTKNRNGCNTLEGKWGNRIQNTSEAVTLFHRLCLGLSLGFSCFLGRVLFSLPWEGAPAPTGWKKHKARMISAQHETETVLCVLHSCIMGVFLPPPPTLRLWPLRPIRPRQRTRNQCAEASVAMPCLLGDVLVCNRLALGKEASGLQSWKIMTRTVEGAKNKKTCR